MRGDTDGVPKGAMQVRFRPSVDWSHEERRRRLQRAYALLLGWEGWPSGAQASTDGERDLGA